MEVSHLMYGGKVFARRRHVDLLRTAAALCPACPVPASHR